MRIGIDMHKVSPAGQPIEVVRQVRDEIRDRITALTTELPPAAVN
jgi:hypothetical protein